jgi:hypothetical protein
MLLLETGKSPAVLYKVSGLILNNDKCQSFEGRRVKEPYSDRLKKMIGLGLKLVQKNPEAELMEKLYFRLKHKDMLYNGESRPGQPQVPMLMLASQCCKLHLLSQPNSTSAGVGA